jgi:glutamyl-tRNA synthetase
MSESTQSAPRVRFAPSPTGYFHVGSARTALYNWCFARQRGGTFVLRIEDTDRQRSDEVWTEGILSSMRWLGIDWDEGPYRQSERGELYAAAAARLLELGRAYYCDCTPKAVQERTKGNAVPGYDGYCRARMLARGPGRALRFRVPDEGVTVVHDVVRGDVAFPNASIEDFVVVKSNGDPLFVLAVVVDDHEMGISHVIRGEEHLPTTPKQILQWRVLWPGEAPPVYAHLPVLVNERRQKLSKRRDRVATEDFRDLGYLPEAMVNYVGILGWSPSDGREVLSRDELVADFRLEQVNRSPAFFDEKRLAHFNQLYLAALPVEEFVRRCLEYRPSPEIAAGAGIAAWLPARFDLGAFERLAPLVQERAHTLGEVPGLVEFLFADPFVVDPAAFAKVVVADAGAAAILRAALERFSSCRFEATALREELDAIAAESGRKLAKAQAPVRVATMGRTVGLPLFESLEVLGREATLARIESALDRAVAERAAG